MAWSVIEYDKKIQKSWCGPVTSQQPVDFFKFIVECWRRGGSFVTGNYGWPGRQYADCLAAIAT